jgi:hydroxylamine oxidation protein HaoB
MPNKLVVWKLKTSLLMLLSGALLVSGSALLLKQIRIPFLSHDQTALTESSLITVALLQGQASDLQGAFKVDSVDSVAIQRNGKQAFSLLLAHYKDGRDKERRVLMFPKSEQESALLENPTDIRRTIWEEAGAAVKKNAAENGVILSWWDDGQRIHFLSGRDTWISAPSDETFKTPVWQQLQNQFLLADSREKSRLHQMARWLTMDSETALQEIRQTFGATHPVYLAVSNDLLARLGEISDYGGAALAFNTQTFQAHDNLHGDIAAIREWAGENGNGNYLVQKEGGGYRVWSTPKENEVVKRTLLVRLLPFVDSLKKLPDGVQLVYQSHWGGYLSIYKLN